MTVEQKKEAIQKHCRGNTCFECVLKGKSNCYTDASPQEIEENYQCLLENGDVTNLDNVDHPSHYNQGNIECIDAMVAAFGKEAVENFCLVNAFKYVWRNQNKNGLEDIDKAIWYLNKYKELVDSDGNTEEV